MRRILLTIEYDGGAYGGWQKQSNAQTIAQCLEQAIGCALCHEVRLVGSGRTDAGVHAYAQMAHFDTQNAMPTHKMVDAFNFYLPSDIAVLDAKEVAADFHARFNAKNKTYLYKFQKNCRLSPLKRNSHWLLHHDLDIEKMRQCAEIFLGEHDFSAFCSSGSNTKDNIRQIYSVKIEQNGDEVLFFVSGNGFLYNMVRIISFLLVQCGKSVVSVEQARQILNSGDRSLVRGVAPPHGLYLLEVKYA